MMVGVVTVMIDVVTVMVGMVTVIIGAVSDNSPQSPGLLSPAFTSCHIDGSATCFLASTSWTLYKLSG